MEPQNPSQDPSQQSAFSIHFQDPLLDAPTARRGRSGGRPRGATTRATGSPRTFLLMDDIETVVHLCNQDAPKWGSVTVKAFWNAIADSFKKETGKVYTNLACHVSEAVKKRRQVLEEGRKGAHSSKVEPP
jgi:hypothetical protein